VASPVSDGRPGDVDEDLPQGDLPWDIENQRVTHSVPTTRRPGYLPWAAVRWGVRVSPVSGTRLSPDWVATANRADPQGREVDRLEPGPA
jgi:hypothetical protein